MPDTSLSEPGSDGFGAVALIAQDVAGSNPWPSRSEAGHPYGVRHGSEPGGVVGVPAGEGERTFQGVAGQVDLAGQAAPGASGRGAAEPHFRAPAACWWARTTVESTDTSQSMSPAASAFAWAAWSIRSSVPSRAHRRNRVCSVAPRPAIPGAATLNVPTLTDLGCENTGDGFRHLVLRLQERPASCALDHRVANGSCGGCHP